MSFCKQKSTLRVWSYRRMVFFSWFRLLDKIGWRVTEFLSEALSEIFEIGETNHIDNFENFVFFAFEQFRRFLHAKRPDVFQWRKSCKRFYFFVYQRPAHI